MLWDLVPGDAERVQRCEFGRHICAVLVTSVEEDLGRDV